MPDIPQRAITAGGAAIERELLSGKDYTMSQDSDEALARVALEASAVVLGEHVAARILQHMEACQPKAPAGDPDADVYDRAAWAWRRHLRVAARIAARAFLTEDDERRIAAEALARGTGSRKDHHAR